MGLELLSEEQTTPAGRKTRTLAIAGSAIALDIVLDNNIVQSTSLSYHGSAVAVSRHMDAANQILLSDLQLLPGQSPLTKTLDSFANNFERLAMLDKLSIVPGLDCHEAVAGIYVSLGRLYDWDLSKLRQEPSLADKTDSYLSSMAMCARHGRPVMHARGKLGLALQYWKRLRLVTPAAAAATVALSDDKETVWSLLVGCAAIRGVGLPPVRVSENWISSDVVVKEEPSLAAGSVLALDWQDPDNISLPQSEENKDAGMEVLHPDLSTTRVPRVMFTATLDPPVLLPQNDWARLYMYANVEPPNLELGSRGTPPTFDSVLFPIAPSPKTDPSEARTISRERDVRVYGQDGKHFTRRHSNTLYIYKPIYSQVVSEIPFSHPRQLIDMLPLLRQYAFLSTLLDNSFGSRTAEAPTRASGDAARDKEKREPAQHRGDLDTTTLKDQFACFMVPGAREPVAAKPSEEPSCEFKMDVILWVHPSPHLQVVFPAKDSTANLTVKILEGGTVEVVEDNITADSPDAKGKGRTMSRDSLARALEHLEDLCKWAEWVRTRL